MKRKLFALCLTSALLLGIAPAQAAAKPTDNVDQLTWQQASAYYSLLYYSREGWAFEVPGNIDDLQDGAYLTTHYSSLLDFNGDGILDLFCLLHPSRSLGGEEFASLWSLIDGELVSLPIHFDLNHTEGNDRDDYKMIASGGSGIHIEAVYLSKTATGYQLVSFEHGRDYDENNNPVWNDMTVTPPFPDDILLYQFCGGNGLAKNDVDGLLERLHQKALQTDLSAAQTLAYWNVMEEVCRRYRSERSYMSIDRDLWGVVNPWFQGYFFDADGDGVTEMEIIGELSSEYGEPIQYWRELWDYDGTKAYLVRREDPYSYTPLIRDSDYIQFDLTRDQLNHHWVEPAQVRVSLNGTVITLSGCLCESNNYIRIRDIAMLLNGTEAQFDFGPWSLLLTSTPYTPTGVEYTPIQLQAGDMYSKTTFDYVPVTPEYYQFLQDNPTDYDSMDHADAFVFGGNNFVKLRDIAKVLDFYVGWDGATGTVVIDPSRGYAD